MLSAGTALAFARPGALWIGLVLIPIVLLYFLRMRFRRKEVGSSFIWRGLAQKTAGGQTLRRRSLLLLLLQAAAVLAAAFSAAGPSLLSRESVEPGVVFLIDASASMASRDCPSPGGKADSRLSAAIAAASKEIDSLGDRVPIMAFACALSPKALLAAPTRDKAQAKAALRSIAEPRGEGFDEGACADGVAAWLSRAGGSWSCRAFTDGGFDLGGKAFAGAFKAGGFSSSIVGASGNSVGVAGLRLEEAGPGKTRAVFSVWNGNSESKSIRVQLTRGKDGEEALASASLVAPRGWSTASIAAAPKIEEGAYELAIERGEDQVPSAPGGSSFLSVSARRPLSVLLVGREDPFIKAALAHQGISFSSLPSFPSSLADPKGGKAPDLVIVDSVAVPAGAACNLLVFGFPPSDAPIAARARVSGAIAAANEGEHPLARFLSWEGAQADACLTYAVKGQAVVLATTGGKPSIAAWEKDGYRSMACGVDLAKSDLGLKGAFPVLLQNFIQWCSPRADEQSAYTLSVGEVARRLEGEGWKPLSPSIEAQRSGPALLVSIRESGIFEWESGADRGYIAANVPASEMDIGPRSLAPTLSSGAASGGKAGAVLASVERETSKPLGGAAAALLALLLAAEWLAWYRGSLRGGKRS